MAQVEMIQRPRVSVSISRKVNCGNYESTDIFVSLACDSEDLEAIDVKGLLGECEK